MGYFRQITAIAGAGSVALLSAILWFGWINQWGISGGRDADLCKPFSGYVCDTWDLEGHSAVVVRPATPAPRRPWVWRARYFGFESRLDLRLLDAGFHLVYLNTAGLYGSDRALALWNTFYRTLQSRYALNPKAALEGLSRGSLPLYHWASINPEKTCAIYADAPVMDLCSWPRGAGMGKGSAKDWSNLVRTYGMTEEADCSELESPMDQLERIASAGIPIVHVVGEADDIVPVDENTDLAVARYVAKGGDMRVIRKAGIGHHPHGLDDVAPLLDFIVSHCGSVVGILPAGLGDR